MRDAWSTPSANGSAKSIAKEALRLRVGSRRRSCSRRATSGVAGVGIFTPVRSIVNVSDGAGRRGQADDIQ
ncbi:hypothetical protein [Kibdelosporangium philippinense]|uniref:hypothetical protein n=1 Tax=Kibdelosporangium philippinense TaxID=211113 RepID=UPI00360FDE71